MQGSVFPFTFDEHWEPPEPPCNEKPGPCPLSAHLGDFQEETQGATQKRRRHRAKPRYAPKYVIRFIYTRLNKSS